MSTTRRRRLHRLGASLLAAVLVMGPGCATFTGMVTGAFTGSVDAPAQIYRINRTTFDNHPEFWIFNLLFFFPVGMAAGPVAGMAKGVAIDVQYFILDTLGYDKAFGTYKRPSVWRPYTIHW